MVSPVSMVAGSIPSADESHDRRALEVHEPFTFELSVTDACSLSPPSAYSLGCIIVCFTARI